MNLIEETGHFNVTNTTFDFDLFSLDESTVRKLQSYLEATATWQEAEDWHWETGVWMATAEVDSQTASPLLRRGRASTSVAAVSQAWLNCWTTTTQTETHEQTQAHMETHHLQVTLWRKLKEEGVEGGVGEEQSSWTVRIFTTHLFFLSLCRAVECSPHPLLHPPALILLPPLQSQYFPSSSFLPLHTHTPYSPEHSSSLPPAVSWSSFLSQHTVESCVCVSVVYVCACERCWGLRGDVVFVVTDFSLWIYYFPTHT